SHEQGHRAWYAHSAGRQLSPPGGLGSEYPTLDLINKASTAGKWLGALVGFLFMALVGALLGSIAWYTRPRPARSRRYE
ncbi:cell division protein DrpB, partial [Escherichia coli]|nr:cell division protein DrpB [Escherichia coli]